MHNAGFGGVELSLLRNRTHYGTATYREKVKATLIHASELGMTVVRTLGAARQKSTPPVQLDPTSMVDLTENVNDVGIVQWEVSEVRWRVFGFWSRETAQRTHGGPASLLVGLFQW